MDDAPQPAANCTAVIVASGGSRRMGFDKLTAALAGRPVLQHTLATLAGCPEIFEIILVCPEERWRAIGAPVPAGIAFRRVDGGAERQDSVAAGLASASQPLVCVHDGARPLVSAADVSRCIAAARIHGAASLARRVADTLRRASPDGIAGEIVDRTDLWAIETPQCAATAILRKSLARASAEGRTCTDETTALAHAGVAVHLVESRFPNPKITTPADLALAAALLP